ncbi:hypothetical protein DUNSADRAFT_5421 [Dunaliella salina]|uniref:Encoded protein n=1 Tax=Dunaliella salina TaxID=3046 RepID=A0ABQ7GQA8_DUNSA|nr:hypothetical protein DUNSADRAFT_5421 [Dunaliella salina]|eukprot:KAF5836795.1 hypothetical protein DUNSADRAFT_5421 [Dunaliella salina]
MGRMPAEGVVRALGPHAQGLSLRVGQPRSAHARRPRSSSGCSSGGQPPAGVAGCQRQKQVSRPSTVNSAVTCRHTGREGAATSRGSRLPTAEAESPARPQSARARAPTDATSLPRFMQPTTATMRHQGHATSPDAAPTPKQGTPRTPGARPGTAPPGGRTPPPASRTSITPNKAGGQEEEPHTPNNNHDQGLPQQQQLQQGGAATPPPSGGLPFGDWSLVRLKKQMPCDACKGTAKQETVDGETDVFQCDQVLEPKALAVVIAHEVKRSEAEGGGTAPKTWVFCPDPLCLDSQPEGSSLPERPPKIQLRGGTKISRAEFNSLKELGLEVGSSTPATTPHADPSTPHTPA